MKRLLIAGLVVEFALIGGVIGLSKAAIDQSKQANEAVYHTQEVKITIDQIEAGMQDMQSGIRGFYITKMPDYMLPYRNGNKRRLENTQKLEQLISDNSAQEERLAEVKRLEKEKIDFMEMALDELRRNDYASTLKRLNTRNGETVMRELQAKLQEMRDEEDRLLSIRRDAAEAEIQRIGYIVYIFIAVGLLSLMLGAYIIWRNITRQAVLDRELNQKTKELESSNKELEQFAYSASHDLQEPLRMVSAYCGLVKKRYQPVLDKEGNEFLDFAIDGAKRMKELIESLLQYSRIGRMGDKTVLPTKQVVDNVLANLSLSIKESDAKVILDELPNVDVDNTSLQQLFQNLISNAIKFRSKDRIPLIIIKGEVENDYVKFSITDNGIGIDDQYKDKLFVIFQRLHTKEKYAGTGIGLAICKKIVDNYKGKIWFESELDKGTTFYFTLPVKNA